MPAKPLSLQKNSKTQFKLEAALESQWRKSSTSMCWHFLEIVAAINVIYSHSKLWSSQLIEYDFWPSHKQLHNKSCHFCVTLILSQCLDCVFFIYQDKLSALCKLSALIWHYFLSSPLNQIMFRTNYPEQW